MNLGSRIEKRRKEIGLSQAELARRVGIRQSTMHSLIKGDSRSSRSLSKIARELRTTAAYLQGDTDDPEQDAPPEPEFSYEERELVECVRTFPPNGHTALLQLARSFSLLLNQQAAPSPSPIELPPEDALARMFEGLLRSLADEDLPLDEQARQLAQLLPTGLAQLRDLLPSSETSASAKQPAPPPTSVRVPQP